MHEPVWLIVVCFILLLVVAFCHVYIGNYGSTYEKRRQWNCWARKDRFVDPRTGRTYHISSSGRKVWDK